MSITVTVLAAKEVKTICEKESLDLENTFLRVGVKAGGCSGFSYLMDLVSEKGEHDEEFEQEGIRVICDPKSYIYLDGVTLDFKDELMGRGFDFQNPNASNCSCNESFCPNSCPSAKNETEIDQEQRS